MEIDLPTGYTYHKNGMKEVSKLVDRIEPVNGDTHINVYLKEVSIIHIENILYVV